MNLELITNIIGLTGVILGLGIRIPQIYKIIKTESATDLSYISVNIAFFNQIIWFSYSYLINDYIYILSSTGHFFICSTEGSFPSKYSSISSHVSRGSWVICV